MTAHDHKAVNDALAWLDLKVERDIHPYYRVIRAELEKLRQRCEELEEDARRYRWLRDQHRTTGPSWHVRKPNNDPAERCLDTAIDLEQTP
jgi:hypothetical protein